MKQPLVSIIIPTYNEEDKLPYCLISLQNQNYPNYEIIVVDNGSTDQTLDILSLFKKVHIDFNWAEKSAGLSRNWGARHARGDILLFLDADEVVDEEYISMLIEPIVKGKAYATQPRRLDEIRRIVPFKDNIFRAITREKFFEIGGFDIRKGYGDDQVDGLKIVKTNATLTIIDEDKPLKRYWKGKWVGESFHYTGRNTKLGKFLYRIGFLKGIWNLHNNQKVKK